MTTDTLYFYNERGYLSDTSVVQAGATSAAPPDTIPLGKAARWTGSVWQITDPDPGAGGGGSSVASSTDRELVTTVYRATSNFTGATLGDIITATRMLDVSGGAAVQVGATSWYNETTSAVLASVPSNANIELTVASGLTAAQLRSAPLQAMGDVADGAGDQGYALRMGGRVTASPAVSNNFFNGERRPLNLSVYGGLFTSLLGANGQQVNVTYDATSDGMNSNSGGLQTASFGYAWNQTAGGWDRLRGSAAAGLLVNPAGETYSAVTVMAAATDGANGATWVPFGNQACSSLDVVNNSVQDIEYRRAGVGLSMTIKAGNSRLVQGITNANQIAVRRKDVAAGAVTIEAEAFQA